MSPCTRLPQAQVRDDCAVQDRHFPAVRRFGQGLGRWILAMTLAGVGVSAFGDPVTNRVLELDGSGGRVELPVGPTTGFEELTEATVEHWVKWHRTDDSVPQRAWNYGQALHDGSIALDGRDTLWAVWADRSNQLHNIRVPRVLDTNRWFHVALATGPAGMRLFLNGRLLATNAYTGSFAELGQGKRHFLGATVSTLDAPVRFDGWIDDVRIWSRARSEEEIRATMAATLNGTEPDLFASWNFDHGDCRDDGPAQRHGRVLDRVSFPEIAVPKDAVKTTGLPLIRGRVTTADGERHGPAVGELVQGTNVVDSVLLDADGGFSLKALPDAGPWRIRVASLADGRAEFSGGEAPTQPQGVELRLDGLPDMTSTNEFAAGFLRVLERDPWALGQLSPPEIIGLGARLAGSGPLLLRALESPNAGVAFLAALALGQVPKPDLAVFAALRRAAHSQGADVRVPALVSLEKLEVPEEFAGLFEQRRRASALMFGGLLLPFALTHLVLFLRLPERRSNLYYGAYALSAALLSLHGVWTPGGWRWWVATLVVFNLLGLRLLYALFYKRLPRAFWFFLGIGCVGIAAAALSDANPLSWLDVTGRGGGPALPNRAFVIAVVVDILLIGLLNLEMLRVVLVSVFRRREGALLIGLGFVALVVAALAAPLRYVALPAGWLGPDQFLLWGCYLPGAGMVAFVGFTSIHLATDFARTYRGYRAANGEIARQHAELTAAKADTDRAARELANRNRDLEEARREAVSANQAKSRFLASVSHELRTPLNAIIGYAEMLAEEAPEIGAASMLTDLDRIRTAARHQLTLINDILDLSKIEAAKLPVLLADFPVAPVVAEVTATVQPLVAKRGNVLEVACPTGVGSMRSDATKLRQILFNLLSNAAKFTERGQIRLEVAGGTARLAGQETGDVSPTIEFTVADTGIGMRPEQVGRLFQAFSQGDTDTHVKYGGTGLGLALSQRFASMLGGQIEVESEPGRGSVFRVRLPVEAPATNLPGPETPAGKPPILPASE